MKIKKLFQWDKFASVSLMLLMGIFFCGCPQNDSEVLPPSLEVNPIEINFSNEKGDSHQLIITTANDVEWTIDDSECSDWLSIDIKKAKGSMTVNLKTTKENKQTAVSVNLEISASNGGGETKKHVRISRDAGISNAYARQSDPTIILSYGMACIVQSSNSTSYFRYKIYSANTFAAIEGNDDLIVKEAEGNGTGWVLKKVQDDAGIEIMSTDCKPSTSYVFVTVAYDRDNNRGEINTFPFETKDAKEDNQPRVKVEPMKSTIEEVHDSNNGPWYKWDASTDGKGTFYLTYACASDKLVETMAGHNNVFGVLNYETGIPVAWNIFLETKKDNLDAAREVSFNKDNSRGREKLFGKSRNNTTQWLEYRNTDKYLQIVTWAFKDNDFNTYSGVVTSVLYHVDNGELREIDGGTNNYYVNASPLTLRFAAAPDKSSLVIDSNDSWTITSNQSWCKIDGAQTKNGSGSKQVEISVTQNESSTTSREAKITLKSNNSTSAVTVTVTQAPMVSSFMGLDDYDADKDLNGGQSYYLSVSTPEDLNFPASGGKCGIEIESNDSWTISTNQSWCIVSKQSGSKNSSFTLEVKPNTTSESRSAVVTIKGTHTGVTDFEVTQDSGVGRDDYDQDKPL